MIRPVQVAFFDLGNTLMYDRESWETFYRRADEALWKSLHSLGIRSAPAEIYGAHETLFHYYYDLRQAELDEPGIQNVFRGLLEKHGLRVPEEGLRAAVRSMYAVTQANWHPEQDAVQMLQSLKERGLRLGIISNGADDENTQTLIDREKLRPHFDFIISSAAHGKRKPHPAIFRSALDHFQVPAEQTVMIGDTYDADILGAHGVGMQSVWFTGRVRERVVPGEIQPDAIVSRLGEIPALLSP
jgi:putative hydrolase of the HAD superfamily